MSESEDPRFEFVDYYGNTSIFALRSILRHGEFKDMNLLSVACLRAHLVDYMSIFRSVHHVTMAQTRLPIPPDPSFHLLQQDFFSLPSLDVDCVISHAAIHCFNDTRYGNAHSAEGFQKPYQVPAKLRQIIGQKKVPVIVSIAVNREEGFFDNNAHLAHDKFVAAFEDSDFQLQDYFFDYLCGGIPQTPQCLEVEYRRSKTLPKATGSRWHYVIGNYYFY
jgi:hypothetical protein